MLSSTVDIHNTRKEEENGKGPNIKSNDIYLNQMKKDDNPSFPLRPYCSLKQILIIVIPIVAVILFAAIFIPVYIVNNKNDDDDENKVINNNQNIYGDEFDYFVENVVNSTYATLTPKGGYDNIFIFLGGITENSSKYFPFFKSYSTFVPKGTKIYFLSGKERLMQYIVDHGYAPIPGPVHGWFNVRANAELYPTPHDFTEAKESLKLVLDEIDRIKVTENIDYKKIYLGGFSQGAVMTNYVLLNSRHELGGYLAFSGYVFDHHFDESAIILAQDRTEEQNSILDARKDYHILATHSFKDAYVPYNPAARSYEEYYAGYTDFKLLSFGQLDHLFPEQPIHPFVRKWLKESMGK